MCDNLCEIRLKDTRKDSLGNAKRQRVGRSTPIKFNQPVKDPRIKTGSGQILRAPCLPKCHRNGSQKLLLSNCLFDSLIADAAIIDL